MNQSDIPPFRDPETHTGVLATGCLSLDWALGLGGFPRGHLVEIYGPPDSGKTTLGLEAAAAAQRAGGVAAFLDAERTLNLSYASALGVDTNSLIFAQPGSTHHALEIVRTLVKTCAVDVIVLDSVAALGPEPDSLASATQSGHSGAFDYWPFVNGLRALHAILPKSPCCVILLNQLRSRLRAKYGGLETSPGAPALHCFASIRVRVERRAVMTSRGEAFGSRSALKVVKNVLCKSGRETELVVYCSGGVSREADLITLGIRAGVIARTPKGLSYQRTLLGMAADEASATLRSNRQLCESIDLELRQRAGFAPHRPLVATAAGGA